MLNGSEATFQMESRLIKSNPADAGWGEQPAPFLKKSSESEFSVASTQGILSRGSSFGHLVFGSSPSPSGREDSPPNAFSPSCSRSNEQLKESDLEDILAGKFRCMSEGPSPAVSSSQLPGPVSTVLKSEVTQIKQALEMHSPFRALNADSDKHAFEKQNLKTTHKSTPDQQSSALVKRKGQKPRVVRACLPCRLSKLKCDDQRPCSNCARGGGSSLCVSWIVGKGQKPTQNPTCLMCNQERCLCDGAQLLGKRGAADALPIERPVLAPKPELVFQNERSAQRRAQMRLFSHQILARYWEAGYSAEVLLGIFRALPGDLRTAIWAGLDAMSFLASLAIPPSAINPDAEIKSPVTFKIPDAGPGTIVMGWDPTTQVRTFVSANQTCGLIARVHLEEFLARIANNELKMLQTELEWLCTIIDDLISAMKPANTRYHRYSDDYRAPESSGTCKLIKSTTVTRLDGQGRGVQSATHQLEVVSDEEYDKALAETPEMCRPFSAMLGDVRTAAELRRDWSQDLRKSGKISEMRQTEEGRRTLAKLTDIIKVVFKPVIDMADGARMQAAAARS